MLRKDALSQPDRAVLHLCYDTVVRLRAFPGSGGGFPEDSEPSAEHLPRISIQRLPGTYCKAIVFVHVIDLH